MAKKKVVRRTRAAKIPAVLAALQFSRDLDGIVCVKIMDTGDEGTKKLAEAASKLLFQQATSQGFVPVKLGGHVLLAERVSSL